MQEAVTQNFDSVSNVTETVTDRNRRGWSKNIATWTLFASCLGTFIFLFATMRIMPKRQNACLFFGCHRRPAHHYHDSQSSSSREQERERQYHDDEKYDSSNHREKKRRADEQEEDARRQQQEPVCSDAEGRVLQCGADWIDVDDSEQRGHGYGGIVDDGGQDIALQYAEERRLERLANRMAEAASERRSETSTHRKTAERTTELARRERLAEREEAAKQAESAKRAEAVIHPRDGSRVKEKYDVDEQHERDGWNLAAEQSRDHLEEGAAEDEFRREEEERLKDERASVEEEEELAREPQGYEDEDPPRGGVTDDEARRRLEMRFRAAAGDGDTHLMASLLKQTQRQSISIDAADGNGWTALHEATRAGNRAAVEFLLQSGADINIRTNHGHGGSPLYLSTYFLGEGDPVTVFLESLGATKFAPLY
jgi:hypothetical protein